MTLSSEQLESSIAVIVKQSGVPACLKPMQMKEDMMRYLDNENTKRSKQKPWSYEHLKQGFSGSFFKFQDGVTPVMSVADTKRMLAAINVLCNRVEQS